MKPYLFKIELCLMLILAWHGATAQTRPRETKHVSLIANNHYDPDHLYREVDLKTQRRAFADANGGQITIDICPVKLDKTPLNDDLQLKVFFRDRNGVSMNLSDRVDKKIMLEQSANYLYFLKQKNISADKAPYTYHASIDAARLAGADKIAFYLSIKRSHLEYFILSLKKNVQRNRDTTGKCPPCDLVHNKLLRGDSTGKCPPCYAKLHFNPYQ